MSYLVQPDPHPGRCPNLRPNGPPSFGTRRCLESELTAHICRFEPKPLTTAASVGGLYQKTQPKPWVVPDA